MTIPEFTPAASPIADVIRSRRTINDFRPDPAPIEKILEAIELARWAPNHKLTEPWRFHLIGAETAKRIVELNTRLVTVESGAEAARRKEAKWSAVPGWLAISYVRSDDPVRNEENYAALCCALQNLALYLWSEGIGIKWSTGPAARHEELYDLLGIDVEKQRVAGLIWYGFPAITPTMQRTPVSEITTIHP